jgi:hypothetical protein
MLSKELGIDQKMLVEYCRRAGILASSALAELTEEQCRHVVEYVRAHHESDLCATAHSQLLVGVCPWCGRRIWWGQIDGT